MLLPQDFHPAAATQDAAKGRLLVVGMVVQQHQVEGLLFMQRQEITQVVVIPAVQPPQLRPFFREGRLQPEGDFGRSSLVAITRRPLDFRQVHPLKRQGFPLQEIHKSFVRIDP